MKKQKRAKKKGLRARYIQVSDFLDETRPYIILTLIVFAIISTIGFIFPIFFVREITNLLIEIEEKMSIMISQFGFLGAVGFIMGNNILSSFMAVVFGFFLGIAPIFSIILNGYLLGFVSRFAVEESNIFILWRLLPHGIFEFPAIIISIALGVRLGTFFVFEKKKSFVKDLGYIFKNCLWTFVLVVLPLLIVAGVIEGILVFAMS